MGDGRAARLTGDCGNAMAKVSTSDYFGRKRERLRRPFSVLPLIPSVPNRRAKSESCMRNNTKGHAGARGRLTGVRSEKVARAIKPRPRQFTRIPLCTQLHTTHIMLHGLQCY